MKGSAIGVIWLLVASPALAQQYEYVRPSAPLPPPPSSNPTPTAVKLPDVSAPKVLETSAWQPRLLTRKGAVLLPTGAKLPVAVFQSTLFETQYELPLALQVAEDVMDSNGRRVIPRGSRVEGIFKPIFYEHQERLRSSYKVVVKKSIIGNYFEAQRLVVGDQSYDLQAVSYPLAHAPDPTIAGKDPSLKGSAYGFAGGVALGIVTGGLALPLVLAGSAVGAMTGGAPPSSVTLEPNQPLTLTLQAPLRGQPTS